MAAVKAAIGDAVLTSLWVFSLPCRGVLSSMAVRFLGVQSLALARLFITTIVASVFVLTFNVAGGAMGGASFNPATTISSYAAGLKPNWTLLSMAIRFPAQAAGAVGGAKAILQLIPTQYKHMIKGPSLKVDLHTGAVVEGVLNFVFNLTIFVVMLRGPKSLFLQVWLISVVTVGLFIAGSGYTGPSINPANAFGWAYVNNLHNNWEFFYVYWIGPLIGAISAAFVFRLLFQVPVQQKQKKKKA
ncbi:aquaporin SIP1-1-like [Tripterygium wilfordii]|uniref:Aquaporin SIP1-1-like n=1 Tax=Tripterygium wilfordii TaxID=458696 RepID=A0A7J7DJ32_TRIWF|nr:aquaporin SIP1-1-like [Tripterygium wilfordii]KAF5746076.1 aquaporin SIP1-1-like [Tripterygium wilfordii]